MKTPLAELSLRDVLRGLGSGDPAPGGGSAAALGGALGTSLVAMHARVSLRQEAGTPHAKVLAAVAEEADDVRERLLDLADEDAAAFGAVLAADKLPVDTDEAKDTRRAAVDVALREATEVPLRIMEACTESISLAKNTIERGNKSAAADGATGAELCRASLRSAATIVKSNLELVEDDEFKGLARTRMDEMLYMGTMVCQTIESYVNDLWR